uniref:Serine/threonine-protein phosphatase 7 long form homolog n=1 Tax=Nicotiana tabacum TaxID=4097 RepID=A0A1S3XFB4_TOBAC|nr:PREDICTED: serine/threonine-protein phosphatase 7 long form homolog [Nicotiana tabacum]
MDFPHAHPGPAEDQLLVLQGDHRSSFSRAYRLRASIRFFGLGSLITALVERWRSETHPFHLPTGEAITLEDVQVLYGLHVDGRAVALPQYIRSMTRGQYLDMMGQFSVYRPQGDAVQRGGSRVALSGIRNHMEFLHPDITSETEDLHIERYTRLALLLLFECVLFPNTSGSLVSMRSLHHLQQLDDLPLYNWGAAVLAYL